MNKLGEYVNYETDALSVVITGDDETVRLSFRGQSFYLTKQEAGLIGYHLTRAKEKLNGIAYAKFCADNPHLPGEPGVC